MMEHKLLSFATIVDLWTPVTLPIEEIRIILMWKNMAFLLLFCLNSFIPVARAGVFILENFHPGYRDFGRKNRDLGNRASPASQKNTSKFSQTKD